MSLGVQEHELSFNNREDVLLLPIPPLDPPELVRPGNSQNWTTTEVGTFKAIGKKGLRYTTLSSYFPNNPYPFCTYDNPPTPQECVALIEKWQASGRPIRYIQVGHFNEAFAIENFTTKTQIATGDIYFTLELEEYRFPEQANPDTGNNFRDPADLNGDGVVDTMKHEIALVKGTTLCEIAETWLGDSDRYADVYEWNKDTMTDMGHPWNKEMEAQGKPQYVKLILREDEPGYQMVLNAYAPKEE